MSFENGQANVPQVEIKDYNVMIDGRKCFNQPVKNNLRTYDDIRKIATGEGDDYTTDSLQDYSYFKNHCKMIAINLCKQQELDADPKAIIIEEAKEIILDFSQETVKVLWMSSYDLAILICNLIS